MYRVKEHPKKPAKCIGFDWEKKKPFVRYYNYGGHFSIETSTGEGYYIHLDHSEGIFTSKRLAEQHIKELKGGRR